MGFMKLNDFNLSEYESEKEVLFNPLSLYRVREIKKDRVFGKGEFILIHLEYGVIFKLLQKNPHKIYNNHFLSSRPEIVTITRWVRRS